MVKIISEGKVPRAEVVCKNCQSILEYGNADLSEDWRNDPVTSWTTQEKFKKWYFKCPVCGCQVPAVWII